MTSNDITVDRAYYVRQLQTYLRAVQRDRTGSSLVPVDGIFGSRTAAALREFQQEEGLPVTGVADRTTWDALYRAYLEVLTKNASPTPIQGYQNPTVALAVGDQGDGVAFLQIMLRRLATRYPALPAESVISGVYSPATARAVSALQTLSGLPPTGQVDKATWNEITALYNTA
ncbi:MAG: peptidoglycan-binding protein [Clostridia bacterium]|nr:peptidoglycan-binding protein [Clostridia bacterium]